MIQFITKSTFIIAATYIHIRIYITNCQTVQTVPAEVEIKAVAAIVKWVWASKQAKPPLQYISCTISFHQSCRHSLILSSHSPPSLPQILRLLSGAACCGVALAPRPVAVASAARYAMSRDLEDGQGAVDTVVAAAAGGGEGSSEAAGGGGDAHDNDVVMPGFRFHPTEEELIEFYLRRKVEGKRFNVELIAFLDLYRFDPWELPGKNQ